MSKGCSLIVKTSIFIESNWKKAWLMLSNVYHNWKGDSHAAHVPIWLLLVSISSELFTNTVACMCNTLCTCMHTFEKFRFLRTATVPCNRPNALSVLSTMLTWHHSVFLENRYSMDSLCFCLSLNRLNMLKFKKVLRSFVCTSKLSKLWISEMSLTYHLKKKDSNPMDR